MGTMDLETDRLTLRAFTLDDAPFILQLLNEPSFLANIGDKGVRTEADARQYLITGPMASYAAHGFGLCAVVLAATGQLIGMCGLLRRPTLDAPDLGYALLPEFWGAGYAVEAADGVLGHARTTLALTSLRAITSLDNEASMRVLRRVGFLDAGEVTLSADAPPVRLFRWDA
jgi:RimJ/RimL family protein N-acetyltransferase